MTTTSPSQPALRNKIAAVLVIVVVLIVAQRLGVLQQFAEPARVRESVTQLGPWGYVAFVVAYALLQPFGVPGTVFVLGAALMWRWPVAFGLSMLGTMAASVVGFSFARFVARDWITRIIPARFRRYEEALGRRGFTTVVFLRFVFWMPPLLHAFFGVSRVPFWTHFWGSLVGYVVPLLLVSIFGQRLFDMMTTASASAWAAFVIGVALLALAVWLVRRHQLRARLATAAEHGAAPE